MPIPLTAPEALEREFLDVRAKLIEVAASLDRIDRADGSVGGDERTAKIRQAIEVLASSGGNRAEQLQLIFSLPYEEGWLTDWAMKR